MRAPHRHARTSLAATLSLLAGSALASDICDVSRYGVPDLDQKRQAASGIFGLPNDGKMYCVPTSWVDWLAYMSNNGYPAALGFAPSVQGPQNWADGNTPQYNGLTNSIATMGTYLGTDPVDGTGGGVGGLLNYLENRLPDDYFIASSVGATNFSNVLYIGPSPKDIAEIMSIGGLVCMGISWYQIEGNHYERKGGHYVAVRSVSDACSSTPTIGYRDPWTGDSNVSQDSFTTRYSSCTLVNALFSPKNDPANNNSFYYKLDTYTGDTKGFFTSYAFLWPNFGAGIDTVVGKIKIIHPVSWLREALPAVQNISFSALTDGPALHLAMHPFRTHLAVVAGATAKNPGMLLDINMCDGSVRVVHKFDHAPGPVVFGRHGQLFECDGSVLKAINFADGSVLKERQVDQPLDAIDFDDATNEVLIIAVKPQRLLQFSEDLGTGIDRPLPEAVALLPHASMAINPLDGKLNICKGDGSVFPITRPTSPTAPLTATSFTLPGLGNLVKSLRFTGKGDALVLDNGKVAELARGKDGRYLPADHTGFGGEGFGGEFLTAQSRTGIDARELETLDNLPPEAPADDEVKDCFSDYNADGFVNGVDFDTFVADFVAGNIKSDVDFDGFVTGIDFDTFIARFAEGC